jgi:hypothetical protein
MGTDWWPKGALVGLYCTLYGQTDQVGPDRRVKQNRIQNENENLPFPITRFFTLALALKSEKVLNFVSLKSVPM